MFKGLQVMDGKVSYEAVGLHMQMDEAAHSREGTP